MRIIGGEFRGRKLDFPKGPDIRPTQDKVREALFNVIAPHIQGTRILDLYSGSGAFGIEALSRGAEHATLVESNPKCISVIRANIDKIGLKERSNVMRMDAVKAIDKLNNDGQVFDIIFMDPPYYRDLPKKILIKLNHCDILSDNNIIIAEHHKQDEMPESAGLVALKHSKKYGDTVLSFYRKQCV